MFNPTCVVLENIIQKESTYSQYGDVNVAYTMIMSFDEGNHGYYQLSLSTFANKISRHLE
jgi:hypothetical protein